MFDVNDRVKVVNQNSQYRNRLGTVTRVDSPYTYVRIDGYNVNGETRFTTLELNPSTLPAPVVY